MHNGLYTNTIYNVQMRWVIHVVLIAMKGNNLIHSKQELTFVHNGLDTNTNYNVQMNRVSIVVLITMNSNNHIHSKQELTFCAQWLRYNYHLQWTNKMGKCCCTHQVG